MYDSFSNSLNLGSVKMLVSTSFQKKGKLIFYLKWFVAFLFRS